MANQGAVINAQQNLAATAARDVLITTVDGQYQLEIKDGGGRATQGRTAHIKEAAIAHQSSLLKAGGDIAVIAGGDIKVKGSHIDAGSADAGDLLLQGQNISIEAVRDRMATDVQTIGAKSYNRVARDNERLVIKAATASQNISIRGIGAAADESGNITFTGANISAQQGNWRSPQTTTSQFTTTVSATKPLMKATARAAMRLP